MRRVVPSQVVEFIDADFSFARSRQEYHVDAQYKDRVTALLRLVNELPDELLIMDAAAYNQFVLSVSTLEARSMSKTGFLEDLWQASMIKGWAKLSPIFVIAYNHCRISKYQLQLLAFHSLPTLPSGRALGQI